MEIGVAKTPPLSEQPYTPSSESISEFHHVPHQINMADFQVVQLVLLVLAIFFPSSVSAFDGGDAAALILGLMIGILGICACLGCYARKRAGQ